MRFLEATMPDVCCSWVPGKNVWSEPLKLLVVSGSSGYHHGISINQVQKWHRRAIFFFFLFAPRVSTPWKDFWTYKLQAWLKFMLPPLMIFNKCPRASRRCPGIGSAEACCLNHVSRVSGALNNLSSCRGCIFACKTRSHRTLDLASTRRRGKRKKPKHASTCLACTQVQGDIERLNGDMALLFNIAIKPLFQELDFKRIFSADLGMAP